MAINVANLKPASLKAKNVATEEYVDSSVNESFATLAATEEARDGQIAVFYQTEAPTANIQFGDYWLDTNDSVRSVYRYENVNGGSSGTLSWRLNTSAIAKSLQYGYKADLAASAAQTTANSKITTFYQPSVPTSLTAGDIWIDTDDGNKMYIANAANVNSIVTSGNGWYNKTLVVPAPDFTSNNDLFAQAQGFANFAEMETSYSLLGSTIINGGYINTGLIQANSITAGLISADAISGKTITGGTITGSKLYGTQIEGAIIKASYLDLSSTVTLTNWQQYTPVTYPSAYDANFAKNNNGTLLVDSQGYVRLMGNSALKSTYYSLSNTIASGYNYLTPCEIDLYPYDAYAVNSLNRCISSTPYFSLPTGSSISVSLRSVYDWNATHKVYLKCYVFGTLYEITAIQNTTSTIAEGNGSLIVIKNGVTVVNATHGSYSSNNYSDSITVGKLQMYISANSTSSAADGASIGISSNYIQTNSDTLFSNSTYGIIKIISGYAYNSANSYPDISNTAKVTFPVITVV